ncbi:DUF2577 domain-containing protein [Vallitalea okinawensis]|uniref:DUF2577 domain-containing protein n=1 Tax=Vallitalea okinawensis TaxID=2078660 RepID=UPI000CFCD16D|nr:DUF2577 domain-containing protein [Vallitalea okinawensis]
MDGIVELAKLFKERENEPFMGVQIGSVLSTEPIKVSLGDKILLGANHIMVCQHVLEYKRDFSSSVDDVDNEGEITLKKLLSVGDRVALIPTSDQQSFVLVDKVVIT